MMVPGISGLNRARNGFGSILVQRAACPGLSKRQSGGPSFNAERETAQKAS